MTKKQGLAPKLARAIQEEAVSLGKEKPSYVFCLNMVDKEILAQPFSLRDDAWQIEVIDRCAKKCR